LTLRHLDPSSDAVAFDPHCTATRRSS
jgi:hypothetical protein